MARLGRLRYRSRKGSVSGDANLFLGTGGATDDGFTYRARTTGAATIQLDYSVNSDLSSATRTAGVSVVEADDFTGGEAISGLDPDTTYYLAPVVDGVRQISAPYYQTKTFPTEGVDADVAIVVSSCQKRSTDAVTGCWIPAAAENADLHLQLGDFVYGDFNTLATLRPAYRDEYTGDQQTYITNIIPRAQTCDDHDSGANNADGDTTGIDLTRQVWREYVPSYALWDSANHIGYSFTIANCEFFVVDTRAQREGSRPRYPDTGIDTFVTTVSGTTTDTVFFPADAPGSLTGNYAIIHDGVGGDRYYRRVVSMGGVAGARTGTLDRSVPGLTDGWEIACKRASMLDMDVLTNGQVDRLCDGINNSTARWKFFCTSVIWNRRFVSTSGLDDCWARWDAEHFEREYIRQRITASNVIVLSGDRHFSGIDDGTLADDGPDWPEMTSSAFHRLPLEPVCEWSEGAYDTTPSYGVIEVDGTNHTVTLTVKDNAGNVASGVTPLVIEAA